MKAFGAHCLLCLALCAALAACSREKRVLASDQPVTPPISEQDPREPRYGANAYQIAQGGRYFGWYGCGSCHGYAAQGRLDLQHRLATGDAGLQRLYRLIASGHGGGPPIPAEQVWQITAYLRDLPNVPFELRRRQEMDQAAEPQATAWRGPLS